MKIYCCNCEKEVEGILVDGKAVYTHRKDLYSKNFYKCSICGGFVGCHPNTTKPLGCIPTDELKEWRKKLHYKMDKLWKSNKIDRKDLYKRISEHIGYTYHNAETRSVAECVKVLNFVEKIRRELCV